MKHYTRFLENYLRLFFRGSSFQTELDHKWVSAIGEWLESLPKSDYDLLQKVYGGSSKQTLEAVGNLPGLFKANLNYINSLLSKCACYMGIR